MKKAKYNEVPKWYRRNYKKDATNFLKMLAICAFGVLIVGLAVAFF